MDFATKPFVNWTRSLTQNSAVLSHKCQIPKRILKDTIYIQWVHQPGNLSCSDNRQNKKIRIFYSKAILIFQVIPFSVFTFPLFNGCRTSPSFFYLSPVPWSLSSLVQKTRWITACNTMCIQPFWDVLTADMAFRSLFLSTITSWDSNNLICQNKRYIYVAPNLLL